MNSLSDFVGVAISFAVSEDVAIVGVGGGLLGCDLLNLRDFKSEALVLGNCAVVCFGGEAEEPAVDVWVTFNFVGRFSFVGLCFWFIAEDQGVPLRRRFFLGRRSFVLSGIEDDDDAEINGEGGGPLEIFWHLSVLNVRKKRRYKLLCRLTNTARGPFSTLNRNGWWQHRQSGRLLVIPNDRVLRWPPLRSWNSGYERSDTRGKDNGLTG